MRILRGYKCGLVVLFVLCWGCSKSDLPTFISGKKSDEKSTAETKTITNANPIELKMKWPVGSRYTERLQVNSSMDTTMGQAQKPVSQLVKLEQEYALDVVKEREKGGREIELEFLSTEMEVTTGGKVVASLDTKSEAGATESNNPLAESFRQLAGTKLKYLLDSSNRVEKVEGVKEFVTKATSASPPAAKGMVRAMFNEEYFKQMMDFGKWMPDKTVKPGDTWPVKTEIAMGPMGLVKTDLNYTFKGFEQREKHNCARLDFTGTLTQPKAATNQAPAGMSVEKGTLSGTTWFDPEAGTPVESNFDQALTVKSTYTMPAPRNRTNALTAGVTQAPAQPPITQSASTQVKQKINIKLMDFSGTGKE